MPKKVAASCEVLEAHEILMLGHLELEAVIAGQQISYQIADHIFIYSIHIANAAMIEKLSKLPISFSVHLIHLNKNDSKLNHDMSLAELKCLMKASIAVNSEMDRNNLERNVGFVRRAEATL
ncbi:MAG: hypothetical protein HWE10_01230 [Gammaproteobacteria bacterium]|nr:hypothetical protein [Gammaproteobacteria bacterium]